MHIVKYCFNFACFSAALGMTLYWMYKFLRDDDLCQVDFKPFDEIPQGQYPIVSFCVWNPFIASRLKPYNITPESYIEILKGDKLHNGTKKIEFNVVTIDLADFYLGDQIKFRNRTTLSGFSPNFLYDLPKVTYSGFYDSKFIKCFGLEMNYQNVVYTGFRLNNSALLDTMERNFEVYIQPHLPYKFALTNSFTGKLWKNNEDKKGRMLNIAIEYVEILKRRNKRSVPCVSDNFEYDEDLLNRHLEKVGCKPPYLKAAGNFKTCETTEKMKEAYFDLVDIGKLQLPCTTAEVISLGLSEVEEKILSSDFLYVDYLYPDRFKEVVMVKAVDIHSAIGNSGGYIGLFLGNFSIWNTDTNINQQFVSFFKTYKNTS